jgi:beta-galactosidase
VPRVTLAASTRQLAVGPDGFERDGIPHLLVAGALHYFRVHPDQWGDRLRKARQLGLNTVETYVPWNLHAPRRGEFRTDGVCDLARFLDDADAEGLDVIVRPGPYICAEWDNGGLPVWLTRSGVRLRTDDPAYLEAVDEFLRAVYEIVVPRQADRGGPVVLVQVENEYGAYSTGTGEEDARSRRNHLEHLVATTREAGITVPLTTVDQPTDEMLSAGTLPGLITTGSFGGRAAQRLATLREHQPTGPLMCSEFWIGWFDHWGSHHGTTGVSEAVTELETMLARGAGVNVYMFHGGTNFGLTNGANDKGTYQPTITSYDYDALLDEAGRPTAKYWAFRNVIGRYAELPDSVPGVGDPGPVVRSVLTASRPLAEVPTAAALPHDGDGVVLDDLTTRDGTPPQLVWLRGTSAGAAGPTLLTVAEVRDRVTVFLDGTRLGTLFREHHDVSLVVPAHAAGARVELLVEDAGRVNYGPRLGEPKGLVGPVLLDGRPLQDTSVAVVEIPDLPAAVDAGTTPLTRVVGPALAAGTLDLDEPADLFLDTAPWGRGIAWFNGFCLGRFWRHGPQRTLYVPAPVTRAGENTVTVLEFDGTAEPVVRTLPDAELGHTEA